MPWSVGDVDKHKKGLTPAQKAQWVAVANSVLTKCKSDGKPEAECAAAAIRQANGVVGANEHYDFPHFEVNTHEVSRSEMLHGRKHLVLPVVMMVEGVHHGSHGPVFHSADELGRFAASWNGIPVVVQHPQENGVYISANDPEILNQQQIGQVFGAHMEGPKLKAEIWVDEALAQTVSPATLRALSNRNSQMEVSIGAFTDDDATEGTWGNEEYIAVARNHRPDHLALLPGGTGACSWRDGCGVRANSAKEDKQNLENIQILKQIPIEKRPEIQVDETGFIEILNAIRSKLDRMDDDVKIHFLTDVYKDFFVYEIRSRQPGGNSGMYRREYTVNRDGSIDFGTEPVAVRREVKYVNNNVEFKRVQKGEIQMDENKKAPCCKGKVDLLIQSGHYTEADRPWLENLEEVQINKVVDQNTLLVQASQKKEDPKPMTKQEALQALSGGLTKDEFLSLAPVELREQFTSGLALHQERRTELINQIQANAKGIYSDDELKAMSVDNLTKIAKIAVPKGDFSGMGGGAPTLSVNTEEMLFPICVNEEGK